jgi:hypothetical protein
MHQEYKFQSFFYSFGNRIQIDQNTTERTNPKIIDTNSTFPEINEPTNIDAKNIVPMSLQISENRSNFIKLRNLIDFMISITLYSKLKKEKT